MQNQSKTEKPTPRRRKEVRKDGQIVRSVEATTAIVLLIGIVLIKWVAPALMQNLLETVQKTLGSLSTFQLDSNRLDYFNIELTASVMRMVLPILVGIMALVIVVNIAQVGWMVTFKSISPKWSRINPFTNFAQKYFSSEALVTLVKAIAKILVGILIVYQYVKGEMPTLINLQFTGLSRAILELSRITYQVVIRLVMFIFVMAILDYAYQKWKFEKRIMMTKEEIKEERKRHEGSPEIKAAIRRRQRQAARSRMMANVPKADVVVTNPIHLAVALQYSATMRSPVVVAKGAMLMADRIKAVAKENQIPIVENKPLAQSLYKLVKIDEEIPANLFTAVAEVLSYVHRITGKRFGL